MSVPVYIASVLLERNRWTPEKRPSYPVSDWIGRFRDAGFDGIELWANHALEAGPEEVRRLASSACPVRLFNSYLALNTATAAEIEKTTALCKFLGADGMKFNFPVPGASRREAVRALSGWMERLPDSFRMLCECHAGTIAESPRDARALFDEIADPRLQAILHPLPMPGTGPDPDLRKSWFDALGDRITHTHVQTRGGRDPDTFAMALEEVRALGFRGTHTIEFTVGTGAENENPARLWEEACRDLQLLRALV